MSLLFWDATRRIFVISYRRFGTTYLAPFTRVMQSKKVHLELFDLRNSRALKMKASQSFQLVTVELFSRLISLIRKRRDTGK